MVLQSYKHLVETYDNVLKLETKFVKLQHDQTIKKTCVIKFLRIIVIRSFIKHLTGEMHWRQW